MATAKDWLTGESKQEHQMTNKDKAIICDLDGTLALLNNRGPYEEEKCTTDDLNKPVAKVLKAMANTHYIIFTSGRRASKSRVETEEWLSHHGFVAHRYNPDLNLLFMRVDDGGMKDEEVKSDIYKTFIRPLYNVEFVFDDRKKVVDMWRNDHNLPYFK